MVNGFVALIVSGFSSFSQNLPLNRCNQLRCYASRDKCPVYEEEHVNTFLLSEAKRAKRESTLRKVLRALI